MVSHPFLYFLIDSKDFQSYQVCSLIKKIIDTKFGACVDLYKRLIIQISSEKEYYEVNKLNCFSNYHYIFAKDKNIIDRIPFLIENNIFTVSIRNNMVNIDHLKILKNKNIYTYVYSPFSFELDNIGIIRDYIKKNAYGVFSNSITNNELCLCCDIHE